MGIGPALEVAFFAATAEGYWLAELARKTPGRSRCGLAKERRCT